MIFLHFNLAIPDIL